MKTWIRANSLFLPLVTSYLTPTEHYHPFLSAKFCKKGITCWPEQCLVYLHFSQTLIDAIILVEESGHIYVYFSNNPSGYQYQNVLKAIKNYTKAYSILGQPEHLLPFESLNFTGTSVSVLYQLMVHPLTMALPLVNAVDAKFIKSSPQHFSQLKELESAYQYEEVLVRDANLANMELILALYKKKLAKERAFHLEHDGKTIAKASFNTASFNYDLLGGVFTASNYRKQGYNSYLLTLMLGDAKKRGRGVSLFVKQNNQAAVMLYKKLGFEQLGPLQIIYSSQ